MFTGFREEFNNFLFSRERTKIWMKLIRLIVAESMDSELSGFARVHEKIMGDLGIDEEGIIEIEFEGRSAKAIVLPHFDAENVVRITKSLRELLGVKVGDPVSVKPSSVEEAKEIILNEIPDVTILSLLSGRIVHEKERIRIGSKIIEVLECYPQSAVRLTDETKVLSRKD
jgi:hypothetical protein